MTDDTNRSSPANGPAPVDPTPGAEAEGLDEGADADAAGADGVGPADPVGGEAIKRATVWDGVREE